MSRRFEELLWALLFVGGALAVYPAGRDAFLTPKEVLSAAVLAALLALRAALGALLPSFRRPWTLLVLLFPAWMILSGLAVAEAPAAVLPASVPWLLLCAACLAAPGTAVPFRKILDFALFGGGLAAWAALLQVAGADAGVAWTTRFQDRAFGTLGNPNYLGGHLAVLLPLAAARVLGEERKGSRFAFAAVAVLAAGALLAARTRGATVAFVGSFLVFFLGALHPALSASFRRQRRVWAPLAAGTGILAFAFFLTQGGAGRFSLASESLRQRVATWKAMTRMVEDHPLTGVGWGNLRIQYPAYQHRSVPPGTFPPYVKTSHGHQEFLQLLAEGGMPGLLLFLVLLGVYARACLQALGRPDLDSGQRLALWGTFAGVSAACLQALSNFPFQVAPTAVVVGLFLATPDALGRRAVPAPSPRALWAAAVAGLLAFGFGIRVLAASTAHRHTEGEAGLGNHGLAVRYAARLADLTFGDDRHWEAVGRARAGAGDVPGALKAYREALRWNPSQVEVRAEVARLLLLSGQTDEALDEAARAVATAWNYSEAQFWYGSALFSAGRVAEAKRAFETLTFLVPGRLEAWLNLGVCRIRLGDRVGAVEAWRRAYALNPAHPQVRRYLEANGALPDSP